MASETREPKLGSNKPVLRGIGMVAVGGLASLATYTNGGPPESHLVMVSLVLLGFFNLLLGFYRQTRSRENVRARLDEIK